VVADAGAHTRVFEDFLGAITRDIAPACDGRSGRQSVAVIEAIYASVRSGRPVDVS
jgi:predicted dehydrogenase